MRDEELRQQMLEHETEKLPTDAIPFPGLKHLFVEEHGWLSIHRMGVIGKNVSRPNVHH